MNGRTQQAVIDSRDHFVQQVGGPTNIADRIDPSNVLRKGISGVGRPAGDRCTLQR
jgi:hypothetical protein